MKSWQKSRYEAILNFSNNYLILGYLGVTLSSCNIKDNFCFTLIRLCSQNSNFSVVILIDLIKCNVQVLGAQLVVGGRPPLLFFDNQKKCPNFGKKALIVQVKFTIQNIALRVSRRKNSESIPYGAFCFLVFDEMFIEVP